jgi:hypothetical protein
MNEVLQCHYVQVNNAQIRREQLNGREHIVLPSYTLPDNVVMNGGLYTHDQIEANYKQLEGTLAPLGHPVVDGVHVSALTPEALHANHVGAWNRNVQRKGNRVYLEKWVDVEFAANSEKGRELLAAVEKGEPIHTSVAVYTAKELTPNAKGYSWIAKITKMDHDAILLGEPGAATPEQGVGLMVNVAQAVPLSVNAGVLADDSYSARQEALNAAARKRWGDSVWVADFDSAKAVVRREDKEPEAIAYTLTDGKAQFADEGQSVKREESWVVNRLLQLLGLRVNSEASTLDPVKPSPEAEQMDETKLAEMLKTQLEAIQANTAEALKPLAERLEALETNAVSIAANAEAPKREAVKAVFGELVANALTGEALNAAFDKLQTAAPLVPGMQANASNVLSGVPDVNEYFGKGA